MPVAFSTVIQILCSADKSELVAINCVCRVMNVLGLMGSIEYKLCYCMNSVKMGPLLPGFPLFNRMDCLNFVCLDLTLLPGLDKPVWSLSAGLMMHLTSCVESSCCSWAIPAPAVASFSLLSLFVS